MRVKNNVDILWTLILLLFASSIVSLGQTITGGINGTVTDSSGAVIAGAKVTALNVATNVATSAITNKDGIYTIRFLQIGQYKVTVEMGGFMTQSVGPFTLEVNQDAKVDASLKVGSNTTSVEVSADLAPILNTTDGSIATTISEGMISELPINGRNFTALTQFVPGVSVGDGNQWNAATGSPNNSGERVQSFATLPNINGNRTSNTDYTLDGIEITDNGANLSNGFGAPAYNPSPDALKELTVITTVPPAEYGNGNGGQVISVLKSGTNLWHGSVFGTLQNYLMDANTFGNKRVPAGTAPTARTRYTQKFFGGTLGGPIRHDKIFFFADYEAYRKPSSGQSNTNVPLNAWRGNTSGGSSYDSSVSPLSGYAYFGKTYFPQMYDSQNNFAPLNQTIGGVTYYNLVPIRNPVAAYLFAHPSVYPLANRGAATAPIQSNYTAVVKSLQRNDQGDLKVDWKLTEQDSLFGRVSIGEANDGQSKPILPVVFPTVNDFPFKSVVLNYTRTITPYVVNEARAGFTRIAYNSYNANPAGVFGTNGNSLVGIPIVSQTVPGFTQQTFAQNTNSTGVSTFGTPASGNRALDNIFEYGDNLSIEHGKHEIKVGGQFIRYQNNFYLNVGSGVLGNFNYSGAFSGSPAAGVTAGYDFADFLMDYSSGVSISAQTGDVGLRQFRMAFFAQDDYKILPKLTVNYGIRYEYDQPVNEVNNKLSNLDLSSGTVLLAGVNGNSRSLYKPVHNQIDPRFGFAYQASRRLVVRGGFGITSFMDFNALQHTGNPPFRSSVAQTATAPTKTASGTPYAVTSGFPAATSTSTSYTAWTNLKPQMVPQYSLVSEFQISNTASVTAQYVGEVGHRLLDLRNPNQYKLVGTPTSAPYYSAVGSSAINLMESEGDMNFNAGELTYRQRPRQGLEFTLNYTYSKNLTDSQGALGVNDISGGSSYPQDNYNLRGDYGPAGSDIRHMLNSTWVYALPFGRGQQFFAGANRVVDEAIGGWKVSGSAVLYSGFPVTITSGSSANVNSAGSLRAAHYRKMKISGRQTKGLIIGTSANETVAGWWGQDSSATHSSMTGAGTCGTAGFDDGVCAYGVPATAGFATGAVPNFSGTAGIGSERSPGYRGIDAAVSKNFPIFREQTLEFNCHAYNVGNISGYNNPGRGVNGSSTWGLIQSTRSQQRQLELALRYKF